MGDAIEIAVRRFQKKLLRAIENESLKVVRWIKQIDNLPITAQLLQKSKIGKIMMTLKDRDGVVGDEASKVVNKWMLLVGDDASVFGPPRSVSNLPGSSKRKDLTPPAQYTNKNLAKKKIDAGNKVDLVLEKVARLEEKKEPINLSEGSKEEDENDSKLLRETLIEVKKEAEKYAESKLLRETLIEVKKEAEKDTESKLLRETLIEVKKEAEKDAEVNGSSSLAKKKNDSEDNQSDKKFKSDTE